MDFAANAAGKPITTIGIDAAGFQFLQQSRNFRIIAQRTAGLECQVLSENVTML